jgi:hypothetical protein
MSGGRGTDGLKHTRIAAYLVPAQHSVAERF